MALAAAGAVIAMAVTALVNWRARRDLARDWADSLKPGRQAGG
jgi:putative membrane protein